MTDIDTTVLPAKTKIDVNPRSTTLKGIPGLVEGLIRRGQAMAQVVVLLFIYVGASMAVGISLIPSVYLFGAINTWSAAFAGPLRVAAMGFAVGSGFFLYGFSMIFVVPALNFILRANLKPWRGPYYSVGTLNWYVHNSLTFLMRYTFLEFITPTPFNVLFYKLMGMKVGRGTQINSSCLTDPSLIELGKNVTIGGSATICAHYAMGGYLIIAPVKIGDGAVIGLRAIVMGGVEIGEKAKILPNSAVLPKTIIPAGETWGGVPAVKVNMSELLRPKS